MEKDSNTGIEKHSGATCEGCTQGDSTMNEGVYDIIERGDFKYLKNIISSTFKKNEFDVAGGKYLSGIEPEYQSFFGDFQFDMGFIDLDELIDSILTNSDILSETSLSKDFADRRTEIMVLSFIHFMLIDKKYNSILSDKLRKNINVTNGFRESVYFKNTVKEVYSEPGYSNKGFFLHRHILQSITQLPRHLPFKEKQVGISVEKIDKSILYIDKYITEILNYLDTLTFVLPDSTSKLFSDLLELEKTKENTNGYMLNSKFFLQILLSLKDFNDPTIYFLTESVLLLVILRFEGVFNRPKDMDPKDNILDGLRYYEQEKIGEYLNLLLGVHNLVEEYKSNNHKVFDFINLILKKKFGVSFKSQYELTSFCSSDMLEKIKDMNEDNMHIIGSIVIANPKRFLSTESRGKSLFSYISNKKDISMLLSIKDFFEENNIRSLTDDEIIYVFDNNLEGVYKKIGKKGLREIISIGKIGVPVNSLKELDLFQLKFLKDNITGFNSYEEAIDFLKTHPDGIKSIEKNNSLKKKFLDEIRYLHASHPLYNEISLLNDIGLDAGEDKLRDIISGFYKRYGNLDDLIQYHKTLLGDRPIEFMEFIDWVYYSFGNIKGIDRREKKKNIRLLLDFYFGLTNDEIIFLSSLSKTFGLDMSNENIDEFIFSMKNILSNKLYAEFLLSSGIYEDFDSFIFDLDNDASKEGEINQRLKNRYGEDGELFTELYGTTSNEILRIVDIGKLLNNADKQRFLNYNIGAEQAFTEDQLIAIYRIYDFFVNKYDITDIYSQVMEFINSGGEDDEIKARIDYLYKKIWKHVDISMIDDISEFRDEVFGYLKGGDEKHIGLILNEEVDDLDEGDNNLDSGYKGLISITRKEFLRKMKLLGFTESGIGGNHKYIKNPDTGVRINLPGHSDSYHIPKNTLADKIRQAGSSVLEWNSL